MGFYWINFRYQLATGSEDNTIKIWDLRAQDTLNTIPANLNIVSDLKFYKGQCKQTSNYVDEKLNIKGQYLASCSFDGNMKIWSSYDWNLIHSVKAHEGKILSLDVSNGFFIIYF